MVIFFPEVVEAMALFQMSVGWVAAAKAFVDVDVDVDVFSFFFSGRLRESCFYLRQR